MSSLHRVDFLRKPMQDSTYRVVSAAHGLYWSIVGGWGPKADARLYNVYEREELPLPERGLWEVVPESLLRKPLERSLVAQTITSYLWTQHCREEGVRVVPRLQDVPSAQSAPFIKAGEFITELTLSPDRFETAVLAMADLLIADSSAGSLSIFTTSPQAKRHAYHLAISMLHALQENVKEVPPDPHYRDALCRELDSIAPKDGGR